MKRRTRLAVLDRRLYSRPHYRWSYSAGVWILQGLHRLAPPEVFPSNLRPAAPVRYDVVRERYYEKRRQQWTESDGFAKPLMLEDDAGQATDNAAWLRDFAHEIWRLPK